ncbi:DoxX family protein [Sanguibacter gelidistatuariae]|uniref:DoxX family protein n=1 Tax=Sanguibacter gelidistatuariae TaxID=1814289 RepID=UPI000B811299|nr:DoxX family protein [Sanguibacter gelidistatuariae]
MLIALWIINVLLAIAFLGAGGMKLARPKSALAEMGMGWVENVSPTSIKMLGGLEVLGAIGLILPLATDIALILTPIAAVCLAITMVGATVVHARRAEPMTVGIVLTLLAVVSAVLGFLAL